MKDDMNKTKSRSFSTPFSQKDFFVKTQGKKKKNTNSHFHITQKDFFGKREERTRLGLIFIWAKKKKTGQVGDFSLCNTGPTSIMESFNFLIRCLNVYC